MNGTGLRPVCFWRTTGWKPVLLIAALLLLGGWPVLLAQLAIKGETVYTMAGPAIENGVVLVRDGKIERVGPASQVTVPAGYQTFSGRVVTPGLIDAHSVVGLSGYLNQPQDQDQAERSGAIQPELRALDAFNPEERLVEWVRGYGTTTIHTGHGPGVLVSGQTLIAKTRGRTVDASVLVAEAMVAATLAESARSAGSSPGTRGKMVAMLRSEFIKAQEYARKQQSADLEKRGARDLRMEALARVLKREIPLLVTVHRARDIVTAIRLAREFNLRLVLDGAAEAHLVIDQIRDARVPVIVHPTMARSSGETENLSMETAARLIQAGVPVALQTGFESYVPKTRVLLFEAAAAAANGLTFEQALAAVTIEAARLLGIDKRVGSLEPGKDADLALFDGDPFEYLTHVTGVVIDGEMVSDLQR